MWIPKCCSSEDLSSKMRSSVKLFYNLLTTATNNGVQKNVYTPIQVLYNRCHVKDRSIASQDTAINNGVQNSDTAKEFIFKYFDVTNYQFNEIEWSGSKLKVLAVGKLSSVTMDGTRYNASDSRPFISIIGAVKKI